MNIHIKLAFCVVSAVMLISSSSAPKTAGIDDNGQLAGIDFPIAAGKGLIVYAKQDKEITFTTLLCSDPDLKQGLNLVGFACPPDAYSAYNLLEDLGAENVVSAQRYNTETGEFETAAFDHDGLAVGVNFEIVPGEGYYINMKKNIDNFNSK